MTTLYLIRGIPGSGKTTLAVNLCMSMKHPPVLLEADKYFINASGVYEFDPSKLPEAHNYCYSRAMENLIEGRDVIVSNTSTTEKEVQRYQKLAEELGVNFVSLIVENRHGGKNVHGVPEDKIQQMKNRFSIKL